MAAITKKKPTEKNDLMRRITAVCDAAQKALPSKTGDNVLTCLGKKEITKAPTLPSGSLALDMALGGGYAKGKFIEIFGPEGGGKTTLCLHAIANMQKNDPNALIAFIDCENALDLYYAKRLGVDPSTMLISQPDSGEHAFNLIKFLVEQNAALIVIDSVAAMAPEVMIENPIGQPTMGVHAKMMSEGIRTLNVFLARHGTTVIFTNQVRCSMGGMAAGGDTTPGGRALRFYASQRVEVKRIGSESEGDTRINNIVVAKVAKNKIAPPFLKAQFKITFGKGIDPVEQAIDFGIELGLIEKSGAWFVLNSNKFQGRRKLYDVVADPETGLLAELEKVIVERVKNSDMLEKSTELQDATPEEVPASPVNTAEAGDDPAQLGDPEETSP